ncbi:MAG: hypothetical protein ACLTXI_03510 [Collinsella sp.]
MDMSGVYPRGPSLRPAALTWLGVENLACCRKRRILQRRCGYRCFIAGVTGLSTFNG